MSEIGFVAAGMWITVGAVAALCAQEYCNVRADLPKLIVALIAGPFAINGRWWGVKAKDVTND